jgi:hypothetical protein
MDDTNLAYLCDEKMREGARQRETIRTNCRAATRASSTAAIAPGPGHDQVGIAPVPWQLQERLGGPGRRRAGGRSALQRTVEVDAYFLE